MSKLFVPKQYRTIQSAIDSACCGDEIYVSAGLYRENLKVSRKNNIKIIGQTSSVIIDGTNLGGLGLDCTGNNLTLANLNFRNFESGLSIAGNRNMLENIVSSGNSRIGIILIGNENVLNNCRISDNGNAAIVLGGNSNFLFANRIQNNARGILNNISPSIDNVFYKNLFMDNKDFAIKISSKGSDKAIIVENTISNSIYGILSNVGRVAIWKNNITDSKIAGIMLEDSMSYVIDNTLINNPTGMILRTSSSNIAGNIVQSGQYSGIILNGNDNYVFKNTINSYNQTGFILNGDTTQVHCNIFIQNCINFINNGYHNSISLNVDDIIWCQGFVQNACASTDDDQDCDPKTNSMDNYASKKTFVETCLKNNNFKELYKVFDDRI